MFASRFWLKNIHIGAYICKNYTIRAVFLFFITEFYLPTLYLEK